MKRRNRKRYLLNLLSLALLAVALYLNFIKKDTAEISAPVQNKQTGAAQSKTEAPFSSNHNEQSFVLK